MTAIKRLLKSCATPPVNWPMVSIFWAWRSCSCAFSRAATAFIRSAERSSTRCSRVAVNSASAVRSAASCATKRLALDFGRLARGDVGANADQRLDAAVGAIYRPAAHVGPVQRTIGPDIAELDVIVVPFLECARDAFIAARAIVGMDRALQVLICERPLRIASKRGFAGCRGFKAEVGQMQLPRAELPGLERGLQQVPAFGKVGKDRPRLILPAPSAHRGANDAHERGWMKRPLKEGDVAERLPEPRGVRIALRTAALMRQQHDRKIRPGRLTIEPVHEVAQIRGLDRLVRDHGKTGAALDLSAAAPADRRRLARGSLPPGSRRRRQHASRPFGARMTARSDERTGLHGS